MNTPLIATITVVLLALACELILMTLLQGATTPYKYLVLVDSTALALMLSPFMYFLMYKPMKNQEKMYKEMLKDSKSMKDIIPICNECGKIRGGTDNWLELKDYLKEEFGVMFLPTECSDCNRETNINTSINS